MRTAYEREIRVARAAALEASARIIDLYGPGLEVRWKGENDPVTAADEASTRVILDHLGRGFPGEPVLIEERTDDRSRLGAPRVWIADPLDGTREFIDRIPEFSVMIGLAEGGRPVMGVVHVPLSGVTFAGSAGGPAVRIDPDGTVTELACKPVAEVADMRLVVSRSHRSEKITRAMEVLGITREVRSGSVGVKIARMVSGEADLYIHLGPGIKLWDGCAPEAILRAAGGCFTDPVGKAIDYNSESISCDGGILASSLRDHSAIADALRRGGLI